MTEESFRKYAVRMLDNLSNRINEEHIQASRKVRYGSKRILKEVDILVFSLTENAKKIK